MALKKFPELEIEVWRSILDYDVNTGVFTWRAARLHRSRIGKVAGSITHWGYIAIAHRVEGYSHKVFGHRLAWAFVHGRWPTGVIDHIDGDPRNNAIANLREVDHTINGQNRRQAQSNNRTSGVLGVTLLRGGKWRAMITVNKRRTHIGCYGTIDEAHQAYLDAKRALHEGCTI